MTDEKHRIRAHANLKFETWRDDAPLFSKTNARPSAVLFDEYDACILKGATHISERARIWLPSSPFEVGNGFRRRFACR
jgi:hypothetical protein